MTSKIKTVKLVTLSIREACREKKCIFYDILQKGGWEANSNHDFDKRLGARIISPLRKLKPWIKCANLNRYTFSLLNIEEKVYLFKSAHFNSLLNEKDFDLCVYL